MPESLPALDALGYALNLTNISPFDIESVDAGVLRRTSVLSIDSEYREEKVGDVTYNVPKCVSIQKNNKIFRGEYISFINGTNAAKSFSDDDSYPLRYFAVSGSTSCAEAARKSFLAGHQYAFFSYTEGSYNARLRDYSGSLSEAPLINALRGVPKSFDSSNKETVRKYEKFFRDHGSHVIISANYGARYPLKVWASNVDASVNSAFNADVKTKFNGIPSGGEFDKNVKNQDQYTKFSEYFQYIVTVSGGTDGTKLANTYATFDDYKTWIASIKSNSPSLLSFQVDEIWTLMEGAKSSDLQEYADPLSKAFEWIVNHPEVYKTAISLDVQSDWAEFNLLTPGAVIIPDPDHPHPPGTVASDTRVKWGNGFDHKTLRFFVINDGSPIDFGISHGSQSTGGSVGKAIVTFASNPPYENKDITDNVYNTRWYFRASVNSTPESNQFSKAGSNTWSEILHDYISGISPKAPEA